VIFAGKNSRPNNMAGSYERANMPRSLDEATDHGPRRWIVGSQCFQQFRIANLSVGTTPTGRELFLAISTLQEKNPRACSSRVIRCERTTGSVRWLTATFPRTTTDARCQD
jgi:hypothetical protein